MRIASAWMFSLALVFSSPALAVYKCEFEGKVTYGDAPCPGGKLIETAVPTVSNVEEAGRSATRERKALTGLEKERHKREAAEQRELKTANRAAASRHKKCDNFARRQQRADAAVRTSVGKANERARLNARRIAEDYEAACGKWPARELGLAR